MGRVNAEGSSGTYLSPDIERRVTAVGIAVISYHYRECDEKSHSERLMSNWDTVFIRFAVFFVFLHQTTGLPVTNANIGIVSGIFIPATTFDNLKAESNKYTNNALKGDTFHQIRSFPEHNGGMQTGYDVQMNPIAPPQQFYRPNVNQQGSIASQIDFNQIFNQPASIQDPIIVNQPNQPQQMIVNPHLSQTKAVQNQLQQAQQFIIAQESLPLINQQRQPIILVQSQQPSLLSTPHYSQTLLLAQQPNQNQALIAQSNQQNAIGQRTKQQTMSINQQSKQLDQTEQRRTEQAFNIPGQKPQSILVSQPGQQMFWVNPQGQQAILISQPNQLPYGSQTVTVVGQARNQAILLTNPSESNMYTLLPMNNQNQNQ